MHPHHEPCGGGIFTENKILIDETNRRKEMKKIDDTSNAVYAVFGVFVFF